MGEMGAPLYMIGIQGYHRDPNDVSTTMKVEMEFIYSNQVQTLMDLPANIKPIGCNWVQKKKRRPDGRVKTFKVRLIAKGYTQKKGIDYVETFSPVAMLKSIQILLSIVAHLDYEIWQMEVKTAFLNGHFEETSIWCNQTVLWLKTMSKEFANCINPFMD